MGRKAKTERTGANNSVERLRDPRVRAFCDALAEIVAAGVLKELLRQKQKSAPGAGKAAASREVIRQ